MFVKNKDCFNAIELGQPRSILTILLDKVPEVLDNWDKWDFNVIATRNNLEDDSAQIIIYLKNKDGKYQQVTLYF